MRALVVLGAMVALLPGAARGATLPRVAPHLPTREDPALAAALARIGSAYPGQAGIFVEDLRTGTFAGWNEDAQLPAASTVKIGLVAEGIRRFGFGAASPIDRDLREIGEFSSNVAANDVFARVGGREPTEAALRRLGMFSSTFPEPYQLSPAEQPKKPKAKKARKTSAVGGHTRVTTARDLARALFRLQSAAAGERWATADTELAPAQARAALGYLSLAVPENSLLSFPAGWTHAEKDGWLDDLRATAAIAFHGGDARIVVVVAYRPGVTLAEARALGAQVSRAAFRR
ncbi:MAG TPA: serine hydrolase [Gaiellaceae bacterium]|nr:serine hydrolase [Gaiellaceae bacterium]